MDDLPFKLPLILDGEITQNILKSTNMPEEECPESWICRHKDALQKLVYQYIAAGSQAVVVPSYGANRHTLKKFGLSDFTEKLNSELVDIIKNAARSEVLICGGLGPLNIVYDEDSEISFEEMIDIYRQQISALKNAGADFLIFVSMTSLCEMRAGMFAAKELDMPAMFAVCADDTGLTPRGTSLLSSIVTMHALGAAAVGMDSFDFSDSLLEILKNVSSYSKIPLLALPNCHSFDSAGYKELEENIKNYINAGVCVLGGGKNSLPSHISVMRKVTDSINAPEIEKFRYRAATNESETYFLLDDENICLSQPIECGYDMADDLIDMEDERVNMLLVKVNSFYDAKFLSFNAYMARLPIAIKADSEEVLEYALLLYQGVAVISSSCDISEEKLKKISEKYGAIII